MFTTTVTKPTTGRQVRVNAWAVDPAKVRAYMLERYQAGNPASTKDLGWLVLDDQATADAMLAEIDGESATCNLALRTWEQALDWRLGGAVFNLIKAFREQRKRPVPFVVAADRQGGVYVLLGTPPTVRSYQP